MKIDVEEWAKANHRSGWRKDPFEMLRDLGKHVQEQCALQAREYVNVGGAVNGIRAIKIK